MKPSFNIRNLWMLQLTGWIILLIIWYAVTNLGLINNHVMPTPQKTLNSFGEMQKDDNLFGNILFSIRINLVGYFKCIISAIIVGFGIGLFPQARKMFSQQV